jgi:hypothetical protein
MASSRERPAAPGGSIASERRLSGVGGSEEDSAAGQVVTDAACDRSRSPGTAGWVGWSLLFGTIPLGFDDEDGFVGCRDVPRELAELGRDLRVGGDDESKVQLSSCAGGGTGRLGNRREIAHAARSKRI